MILGILRSLQTIIDQPTASINYLDHYNLNLHQDILEILTGSHCSSVKRYYLVDVCLIQCLQYSMVRYFIFICLVFFFNLIFIDQIQNKPFLKRSTKHSCKLSLFQSQCRIACNQEISLLVFALSHKTKIFFCNFQSNFLTTLFFYNFIKSNLLPLN